MKLAEAIRQKRENELNKPEIYNEYEKERLKHSLEQQLKFQQDMVIMFDMMIDIAVMTVATEMNIDCVFISSNVAAFKICNSEIDAV